MIRARWAPGPVDASEENVFVSATDFRIFRLRDIPGAWLSGLRLRRTWPQRPGAVGLWLWAMPLKRRSGSVSIWRNEDDLREFVRWPVHAEIMRRNRDRGEIFATGWEAERADPEEAWRRARAWVRSR